MDVLKQLKLQNTNSNRSFIIEDITSAQLTELGACDPTTGKYVNYWTIYEYPDGTISPYNMIPLTSCKHGYAYRVLARNFSIGVFHETKGFIGIRSKFDLVYLDTEYHYDIGEHQFGTVRPKNELEKCPIQLLEENEEESLFNYISSLYSKYKDN